MLTQKGESSGTSPSIRSGVDSTRSLLLPWLLWLLKGIKDRDPS